MGVPDPQRPPGPSWSRALLRAALFVAVSAALHLVVAILLLPLLLRPAELAGVSRPTPITLLDDAGPQRPSDGDSPALPRPEDPEAEKEEEEKEPEREDGQVVDVAPPNEERRPDEARFLAEYDITVSEETRTNRFRLESDVRAPTFSQEDAVKFEEQLQDLGVTTPSSGGSAGSQPFDAERDGRYASLPSPYRMSNKAGLEGPVPVGSGEQRLSGSPSNDLIDARLATSMSVNTREVVFAAYINRIKRIVSFYWNQNLDNLPGTIRLSRPRYETEVYVVLDDQGALQSIEVTESCGEDALDQAVVQAFRQAGAFPDPPEALVSKDGQVHLDDMGFTVQIGGPARAPYAGVDPRGGVQFPGILKATR